MLQLSLPLQIFVWKSCTMQSTSSLSSLFQQFSKEITRSAHGVMTDNTGASEQDMQDEEEDLDIPEYERIRAANIKNNLARMQAFGLSISKPTVQSSKPSKPARKQHSVAAEANPTRRSHRASAAAATAKIRTSTQLERRPDDVDDDEGHSSDHQVDAGSDSEAVEDDEDEYGGESQSGDEQSSDLAGDGNDNEDADQKGTSHQALRLAQQHASAALPHQQAYVGSDEDDDLELQQAIALSMMANDESGAEQATLAGQQHGSTSTPDGGLAQQRIATLTPVGSRDGTDNLTATAASPTLPTSHGRQRSRSKVQQDKITEAAAVVAPPASKDSKAGAGTTSDAKVRKRKSAAASGEVAGPGDTAAALAGAATTQKGGKGGKGSRGKGRAGDVYAEAPSEVEVLQLFQAFRPDHNGNISMQEVANASQRLELGLMEEQFEDMMWYVHDMSGPEDVDAQSTSKSGGNDSITLEQFQRVIASLYR